MQTHFHKHGSGLMLKFHQTMCHVLSTVVLTFIVGCAFNESFKSWRATHFADGIRPSTLLVFLAVWLPWPLSAVPSTLAALFGLSAAILEKKASMNAFSSSSSSQSSSLSSSSSSPSPSPAESPSPFEEQQKVTDDGRAQPDSKPLGSLQYDPSTHREHHYRHLSSNAAKKQRRSGEKAVPDLRYYVEREGYKWEDHSVITEDGFVLSVLRIVSPKRGPVGRPILLMHGLFQCSGIYVCNEEESSAFFLVEQGFDVWLGNNRGVDKRHLWLHPDQLEFWDWSLDKLRFDFKALVNYVCEVTRATNPSGKIVYAGHSQGNAQAFVALHEEPALADRLHAFVALAPAYYIADLKQWPLSYVTKCRQSQFYTLFGRKEFIPIMSLVQSIFPAVVFQILAYRMFSYLFNWVDDEWDPFRKDKYFQFSPRPTSSKAIAHWAQNSALGRLAKYVDERVQDEQLDQAHTHVEHEYYDWRRIRCPTVLFVGQRDFLVDGGRLADEMAAEPDSPLFRVHHIKNYEHMDLIWSVTSIDQVFRPLVACLREIYAIDDKKIQQQLQEQQQTDSA